MNCRIVGAICQDNFAQAQTVLVSFQRKKALYFDKSEKTVTLTIYFVHFCPCFHLTLNKIPLNKTKNASDVWPRWNITQCLNQPRPQGPSPLSKWRVERRKPWTNPKIVDYLLRDAMKWRFRRLFSSDTQSFVSFGNLACVSRNTRRLIGSESDFFKFHFFQFAETFLPEN